MTAINDALAFLLELCALAALAVWGAHVGGVAPAIAAPLATAVLWGAFVAPKAAFKIPFAAQNVIACAVFVCAGVGLAVAGPWGLGLALAVTGVANRAIVAWQRPKLA